MPAPVSLNLGLFEEVYRPLEETVDEAAARERWARYADAPTTAPEFPPLVTPTEAELRGALADYAASCGLLGAAQTVRRYGGATVSTLTDEGQRFLYWELTQTLIEEVL